MTLGTPDTEMQPPTHTINRGGEVGAALAVGCVFLMGSFAVGAGVYIDFHQPTVHKQNFVRQLSRDLQKDGFSLLPGTKPGLSESLTETLHLNGLNCDVQAQIDSTINRDNMTTTINGFKLITEAGRTLSFQNLNGLIAQTAPNPCLYLQNERPGN